MAKNDKSCPEVESDRPTFHVDQSDLFQIGVRPPLRSYLSNTWKLRHFIFLQGRLRSLSGSKGTLLGRIWLILEPFLRVGMYFVIFGVLLKADRGIDNFVAYLAIGIMIFGPLSQSLGDGANFANRNRAILKAFSFPRASLVVSDAVRNLLDSIPEIVALLIFIVVVPQHESFSIHWLLLVPLLLFREVLISGIVFICARLDLLLPDLKKLWPIVSRFWFYSSAVIFPIDKYVHDPNISALLQLNPAFTLLQMSRTILMDNSSPDLASWLQLVGWSVFVFVIGLIGFWMSEVKFNRAR